MGDQVRASFLKASENTLLGFLKRMNARCLLAQIITSLQLKFIVSNCGSRWTNALIAGSRRGGVEAVVKREAGVCIQWNPTAESAVISNRPGEQCKQRQQEHRDRRDTGALDEPARL